MPLKDQTINDFLTTLSSSSPTPGGGSASALIGAISSALVSMVASLTVGKEKYKGSWRKMEKALQQAKLLQSQFLFLAECDIQAFNEFMKALRLPKVSEEEKALRATAIETAAKNASLVPLGIAEMCVDVAELSLLTAKFGNKMAGTDAAIAALLADATARSARYNVLVNLPMISDTNFVATVKEKLSIALQKVSEISNQTVSIIDEQMEA